MTSGKGASNFTYSFDIIYFLLIIVHLGINSKIYSHYFKNENGKKKKKVVEKDIEDNRFMRTYKDKSVND